MLQTLADLIMFKNGQSVASTLADRGYLDVSMNPFDGNQPGQKIALRLPRLRINFVPPT
jgi:hypothetical protein